MDKKTFKNKENPCINHYGEKIWVSRSVAVAGVIIALYDNKRYVLTSKRGPNAADFQGLYNLTCGYLDWDESGPEAMIRELYEETGFDMDLITVDQILKQHMDQPWYVASNPTQSRQNVTLRYGLYFMTNKLPKLTTKYNPVIGEVVDPIWMPLEDINNHEWAFNHNDVIRHYMGVALWIHD